MVLTGNTILITGGGTGIGLALAAEFVEKGNRVLICGRREEKLAEAKAAYPPIEYRVSDLAHAAERASLADWAIENGVNVLVNNAGIQREVDFSRGIAALDEGDNEVRINFEATVYLTALLTPHLMQQQNSAICNVTSGLGYVPMAIMPIYCATKAAIHSFTVSLRHQLQPTGVKVFEIIPPTVDTELDRGARARRGQVDRGISPVQVAKETMEGLAAENFEIAIGIAANLMYASKEKFDQIFARMNQRR